jgi:uncharacterized protein (DUF2147 family)
MKVVVVAAALLLSSTLAQAGDSYSFDIGGRSVTIHAPRGCDQPSCISVSIPGIFHYGPKRGARIEIDREENDMETSAAAPVVIPPPPQPPVQSQTRPTPSPAATASQPVAPRTAETAPAETKPTAEPAQPQRQPAQPTVVANAPVAAPVQQQQAPAPAAPQAASSPLGVWLTEEKEGKVRIEACGSNLCGYSIDASTNRNKDKVLINMRPTGAKWSGRIHDPKGGGTYDSTIALKGSDKLRVQGCAFGGMFCGGQTWTRVE